MKMTTAKKVSCIYTNIRAFTLSEVLITLGVIGIVAAMGIPALVNNYQKREYVSRFKKVYSQLNEVLVGMANDGGCIGDLACTGFMHHGQNYLGDEISKRFKIYKNCGPAKQKGCWPTSVNLNYDGSGATANLDDYADYKIITADGFSIMINVYGDDCKQKWWTNSRTKHMQKYCGYVFIDVNGLKKPNYLGRDIFRVAITNNPTVGLYPAGGLDDRTDGVDRWWNGSNKSCYEGNKAGMYCAGRVIEEGWEMNY